MTNKVLDSLTDGFEKVSSPRTRAGATVERAGKMLEGDVHEEVVALQMTKNSPNGYTYTREFVRELGHLAEDTKTRVLITAKQGRVLIEDASGHDAAYEPVTTG